MKIRRSNTCKKKCWIFFYLRLLIFFRDYSFLLSEAKYKAKYGEGLKILTPKQMIQTLPITLAEVKAGNTSQNLLNQIRQIIYFLYWAKELLKKYIMNSIKLQNRMDIMFRNSGNSKTSDPDRVITQSFG